MWTPVLSWTLKLAQKSEIGGCIGYRTIEEEQQTTVGTFVSNWEITAFYFGDSR